jgi:hypothetical protein
LLRRVVWQNFTGVSEMLAASIIRAMMEALIAVVMEAASASEMSIRRNNPEDSHFHTRLQTIQYS